MGWAYGHNAEGREVGYSVAATCDLDGCDEKIDRGLAYVCGGMHDGGEFGCGRYFCPSHLYHFRLRSAGGPKAEGTDGDEVFPQLCDDCGKAVHDLDDEEADRAE